MEWRPTTWEDIRKYYADTYIKIPDTGDQLWYVLNVSPDGVILRSTDEPAEETLLELHEDQPYIVEMILPHKSTFQYQDLVCFIERIPAQQYRRGISSSNCKLWIMTQNGTWQQTGLEGKILNAYVNKQVFSPLSILKKTPSLLGIALSPRWSINKALGRVFVDTIAVGSVNLDKKTYTIPSIIQPEFEKILKYHGEYGTFRSES